MIKISKKDKDKIIEDYLNGIPVSETAKGIGRSKSTIYNIVKEEVLTKEDFGRNLPSLNLQSEEEEKDIPAPKTKIDDESSLFDLFTAMGIKDNKKMQLYYSLLALSKTAGVPPEDYIEEVVIPLMRQNLRSGIQLDDISINEFYSKPTSPKERLEAKAMNELERMYDDEPKEVELTPEQEALKLKQEEEQKLEAKEKKINDKITLIKIIFPPHRWTGKLFEYAISTNDSELINRIIMASKFVNGVFKQI